MKLLKMNKPQCLLYSTAMVLNETPENLIKEIGHDGLDKWWPELKEPFCYRSFHPQEILDCFMRRGFGFLVVESDPHIGPDLGSPRRVPVDPQRMKEFLNLPGILIGTAFGSNPHAAAWDGKMVFDPGGMTYNLKDFNVSEFWAKIKLY